MQITSLQENGQLTLLLAGEIDHHSAKKYMGEIDKKLEVYTPTECILDFQDVTFMDSSGIAVIINALRAMTRIGGSLLVSGLQQQPMKVFKTSGVDKLVSVKE